MISRVPDFFPQICGTVQRYENVPFEWGATDCAHFAADCIRAATGTDVLALWRGRYASRLEAEARLRGRGYLSAADAAASTFEHFRCAEIDPHRARVGDIGVTADDVLCVRFVPGFLARAENGKFYTARPVRAWQVG